MVNRPENRPEKPPFVKLADQVDLDEALEMKDVHFGKGSFMPGWREAGSPTIPAGQHFLVPLPDASNLNTWTGCVDADRVERRHIAAQLFIFRTKCIGYQRHSSVDNWELHEWMLARQKELNFENVSTPQWRKLVLRAMSAEVLTFALDFCGKRCCRPRPRPRPSVAAGQDKAKAKRHADSDSDSGSYKRQRGQSPSSSD
jgi:hypothetical protein